MKAVKEAVPVFRLHVHIILYGHNLDLAWLCLKYGTTVGFFLWAVCCR